LSYYYLLHKAYVSSLLIQLIKLWHGKFNVELRPKVLSSYLT